MNNNEVQQAEPKKGFLETLKIIGPGVIVAAVVVGPGSVTTASSMGASYGYVGVWIIVVACILSYFYQEGAVRMTLNTKQTLFEAIRDQISPMVAKILCVAVWIVMLIAQASNFVGAGMAMNYFVPQLSVVHWAAVLIILAVVIVLLKRENLLDSFTKWLVLLMVLSFVITALACQPNAGDVVSEGFSFHIPGGQWILALGLFSTTMVPDTPLAISVLNKDRYIVANTEEARYSTKVKMHRAKLDLGISLVVTGVITGSIMICSATVLKPQGIEITSAADMAIQLTPVLGKFAGILFSLGLFGAAFSSGAYRIKLLPEYTGYTWNYKPQEHLKLNSALVLVGGIVPFLLVIIFGGAPVPMIIVSQATLGILLPFIAVVLWILLNKKEFMGEARNRVAKNIIFAAIFALTLFLAVRTGINIMATLAG